MRFTIRIAGTAFAAVLVAACSAGASPSPSAVESVAPSIAPSASAEASPSPTANACAKESLTLVTAGKLTIGKDRMFRRVLEDAAAERVA